MNRHELRWGILWLGLVISPIALGGERISLSDASDLESAMSFNDEEFFTFQPVPGTTEQPSGAATDAARARTARPSARSSYARQARAPNMFGDFPGIGGQLAENDIVFFVPVGGNAVVACPCGNGNVTDLPGLGGGIVGVAENNKPLPADRIYFVYNGFQNALNIASPTPFNANINRYTVGFEKTFADGLWSVNMALPFYNSLSLNSDAFSASSGSFGNLAVYLKGLFYAEDDFAVSAGVGVSAPTGSSLNMQTHQFNPVRATTDTETLVIQNNATYLVPYIGFLSTPSDDTFLLGFLSLDAAANGNTVNLGTPANNIGKLTPQNLLHVDLTAGRWLMQDIDAYYVSGIAALAELHYTSTVQDTDTLLLPTQPDVGSFVNGQLSNVANRQDFLNLTAGFQFQIGDYSNLRVGGIFPLRNEPNRVFDSEVQVSFNRMF